MKINKYIFALGASLLFLNGPVYAKALNLDSPKKTPKTNKLIKDKKTYSLGGQVILKDSVEGGKPYLSISAKWKPDAKNYWFIRGTARHNFEKENSGFRYSWGLGYDDWHTGTWSAQLNNYEPIKIGEGLDIDNAIASIGYKLDSKLLKDNKLSSQITLSKQIKGEPKLSASLKWSPMKNWFIKGIMIGSLEDGDLTHNYLFGYDDWRTGSFGFEYSNYESNPLGDANFSNGRFALTYKWKFK